MKAIAFAQRLLRDLKEKDLAGLAADTRLELVDAINSALQQLHAMAPAHSKITQASLLLKGPQTVILDVVEGSTAFGGYLADSDDYSCTIRIDGDGIDNQITGPDSLLNPYSGPSGTVSATIYHDAAILPEPVAEIIDKPQIVETRERLLPNPSRILRPGSHWREGRKPIMRPETFWVESNARNNNPPAPAVFRVDTLPPAAIRLQMEVLLAPARVSFASLLDGEAEIPVREEHVEAYLIPLAREGLVDSSLWRNPETREPVRRKAGSAKEEYGRLVTQHIATPNHRVGTPRGH